MVYEKWFNEKNAIKLDLIYFRNFARMTDSLRKLLYPFSMLYEGVTKLRNKLYDKEILKPNEFDIPLIVVGNLKVGGTGKTPQVAYIVKLLKDKYRLAVLSRGYKRETTSFILADKKSNVKDIGDEAYQLYRQNSDILVAVDADRTNGITTLLSLPKPPQVIILDDAFQHRKIKAGFNVLLTAYGDLYTDDSHLPSGNLRENVKGAERAQLLLVTKCPPTLTQEQEYETAIKLNPTLEQTIFFTHISYANFIQNESETILLEHLHDYEIVLVTGIANPKPLIDFLNSNKYSFKHLSYPDHHHFSKADIQRIKTEVQEISNKNKLILTTEKDYVRIFESLENLYYLAIETTFSNHQNDFDKLIIDYVGENTRNG